MSEPKEGKFTLQLINTALLAGVIGVGGYVGTQVVDTHDRVIRIEVSQQSQTKAMDDLGARVRALENRDRRLVKSDQAHE